MLKRGQTFQRIAGDGPDRVRFLGWRGSTPVFEDADEFASPFVLTAGETHNNYGADATTPPAEQQILNEQATALQREALKGACRREPKVNVGPMRKMLRDQGLESRTPEEVFDGMADSEAP